MPLGMRTGWQGERLGCRWGCIQAGRREARMQVGMRTGWQGGRLGCRWGCAQAGREGG